VPQGWQSHGLHARGREVLEDLFPGLTDELAAHGASPGDVQADVRWIQDGHSFRRRTSGMTGIAFSRPLLEDRVRARVRALPSVTIEAPVDVLELLRADGGVGGVRVRDRDGGTERRLAADLVVDATGRGSHLPVWLDELGYPRPAESAVEIGLGYTTWRFPRLPGDLDGDIAAIVGPTLDRPRVAAVLATEGDRWEVTAGGYCGDAASADDVDAFRAFTASLPAPDVADLLAGREPIGRGRLHRFPSSRRRHYERLDRFPSGLLAIGDALASFNPAYGQGMTVTALEAEALRGLLAENGDDLARRFFRRAARIIDIPWDIAVGGDLRMPQVPGARPLKVRVVNAYLARVFAAAAVDAEVGEAFLRVANTVDRPEALLRPAVALRVARAARRTRRPTPPPVPLPRPRPPLETAAPEATTDRSPAT
jgi:2-polyprenyl-6-methoxyphenol hydroxylase-like FAD-dependent oxidoreductase